MKKLKKSKFIFILIAIVVVATVGIFIKIQIDLTPTTPNEENDFLSTWMNYLDPSTRLVDIVMPAAHDAGTKDMILLAETQSSSIGEQLEAGVRCFDLRLTGSSDPVFYHGIIDSDNLFVDAVNEIKSFMDENPSEFLLLYFQHYKDDAKDVTVEIIEQILEPEKYALSGDIDLATLTYGDVMQQGKRYMILYGSSPTSPQDYVYDNDNDYYVSPYYEAKHNSGVNQLISELPDYELYRDNDKFFALQMISTLSINSLISPSAFEALYSSYLNEVTSQIGTDESSLTLENTNIILRDYCVIYKDVVPTIIQLNITKGQIIDINGFEENIQDILSAT